MKTSEIKNGKEQPKAISVSDFLEQINASLLSHRGRVLGEVTSLRPKYPPAVYFTIKDKKDDAILECTIWRSIYEQNSIELGVGDEIIITGAPEVYAPRGRLSFMTQTIEYAGEGDLKKQYEALKKKLFMEGLFDIEKKHPLPEFPQKIGVITSNAGVVMQDFSSNLGRYGFKVTVVDSRVEGKDSVHDILSSIRTLEKQDIEILVIMRGGGSWESLQPFNTESVVRAIANFKCPVLTGIGHDADVTLAELVADVGASTPTAVAEAINESWDTLINSIESAETKVVGAFRHLLSSTSSVIESKSRKIYILFTKLEKKISKGSTDLQSIVGSMKSGIRGKKMTLEDARAKIIRFSQSYIHSTDEKISNISKSIKIVDPEHNLKLGYSLSYVNGKLIRSIQDVDIGETTQTHLSDGTFISEVKNIK